MATTPVSDELVAGTASMLRSAHAKCRGLSDEDVLRAIKICAAYALRGLTPGQAGNVLRRVVEIFGGGLADASSPMPGSVGAAPETERPCPAKAVLSETAEIFDSSLDNQLDDLLKIALGRDWRPSAAGNGSLGDRLEKIKSALQSVRALAPDRMSDAPLDEIAAHLEERLSNIDDALKRAAGEFVEKLLAACDPESAKERVKRGKLEFENSYKAALFDSLAEKFSYLRAYHENGRLTRDFRTTFRKFQKQ